MRKLISDIEFIISTLISKLPIIPIICGMLVVAVLGGAVVGGVFLFRGLDFDLDGGFGIFEEQKGNDKKPTVDGVETGLTFDDLRDNCVEEYANSHICIIHSVINGKDVIARINSTESGALDINNPILYYPDQVVHSIGEGRYFCYKNGKYYLYTPIDDIPHLIDFDAICAGEYDEYPGYTPFVVQFDKYYKMVAFVDYGDVNGRVQFIAIVSGEWCNFEKILDITDGKYTHSIATLAHDKKEIVFMEQEYNGMESYLFYSPEYGTVTYTHAELKDYVAKHNPYSFYFDGTHICYDGVKFYIPEKE